MFNTLNTWIRSRTFVFWQILGWAVLGTAIVTLIYGE